MTVAQTYHTENALPFIKNYIRQFDRTITYATSCVH